jgi:Family of unknown function (DUF5946)
VTCSCGAVVPKENGPTHAYMQSEPACWRRYGELTVRVMPLRLHGPAASHVDCFAASHPGGADRDRRQRASVAIHLMALCLGQEHGFPLARLNRLRADATRLALPALGLQDWPFLTPPIAFGDVTVGSLYDAADEDLPAALEAWPPSVWAAWVSHHETIRHWSDALLRARWRP